jgi:hypothetical protein
MDKRPDHANCPGCGCHCHQPSDRDRDLWQKLADEISAYLDERAEGQPDLFGGVA